MKLKKDKLNYQLENEFGNNLLDQNVINIKKHNVEKI
jgi:hypothetical protein